MEIRDLDDEFRLEELRDFQGKRRAGEHSEFFSLVERATVLLITVVSLIFALIHYPSVPSIPAIGFTIGGGIVLIYRMQSQLRGHLERARWEEARTASDNKFRLLYIASGMAGSRPRERDLFTALGHPLRRRILRAMVGGAETSPLQLSAVLRAELTAVSYHVRMLAECGAIELVRVEKAGMGVDQHFYRPIVSAEWALSALRAEEEAPASTRRA